MSLLDGKFRGLMDAAHKRFLSDGQLIHTPRTNDGKGNLVAGTPVPLAVCYSTNTRTFRDADGVERSQSTVMVLREGLLLAASAAGLAQFVADTDDLDAIFIDVNGNRYDTGRATIDPGDAYVTIDVRLLQSG